MAYTGSINGAGRFVFYDSPIPSYELTQVKDGLWSLPLDIPIDKVAERRSDIVTKPEFNLAAKNLNLGGVHGSPAFGALAKHFLNGHPEYRNHRYCFAGQGMKPMVHYVLDAEATNNLIESGVRVSGLTPVRLLVARLAIGTLTDDEVEMFKEHNSGMGEKEILGIIDELEYEGFEAKRLTFESHELVKTNSAERERIIVVVRGKMLADIGGEGFLEYSKTNAHIRVPAGMPIEVFIPDGGCEIIEAKKVDE